MGFPFSVSMFLFKNVCFVYFIDYLNEACAMGASSGTGPSYPSRGPEFIPCFL
jgi:hypothetical protein